MVEVSSYVIEVVQGETFFVLLRVLDSDRVAVDLSSATKSVTVADGITDADITVSAGDNTGELEVRAPGTETVDWPEGTYRAYVWLDWGGAADIEDEIIADFQIVVRPAI